MHCWAVRRTDSSMFSTSCTHHTPCHTIQHKSCQGGSSQYMNTSELVQHMWARHNLPWYHTYLSRGQVQVQVALSHLVRILA